MVDDYTIDNINEPWDGHSFKEVEDFIKNELETIPVIPDKISAFTNDVGYATEDYIDDKFDSKQDKLINGENIRTLNNRSLLGSGNLIIPSGKDGKDAINPFKGWFDTFELLYNTFQNPNIGDYAYVKSAIYGNPAKIYECKENGTWHDSGRLVVTTNIETFETGEKLNEVKIIDNTETNSYHDVLSARQGKVLGDLTMLSEAYEEKVEETQYEVVDGKSVMSIWGTSGTKLGDLVETANTKTTVIEIGSDCTFIRFKSFYVSSETSIGACFYGATGEPIFPIAFNKTDVNEVTMEIPQGAYTLKCTSQQGSHLQKDFYCYLTHGKPLSKKPSQDLGLGISGKRDESPFADDVAKLISKFDDLNDIEILPLEYDCSVKGRWNTSTHRLDVAGTSYASSYIDVLGYDRVAFLVNSNSDTYGYVFLGDDKTSVIEDGFYKLGINIKKVPKNAKYLCTRTNWSVPFVCYGINGSSLYDNVDYIVGDIVSDKCVTKEELSDYVSCLEKNLLDPLQFLKNYTLVDGYSYEAKQGGLMSGKLQLTENETYTIQGAYYYQTGSGNTIIKYAIFDESDNYLGYYNINPVYHMGGTGLGKYGWSAFTYNKMYEDEAYIRIVLQYAQTISAGKQLEIGSQPSEYVDYGIITCSYDIAKESELENIDRRVDALEENMPVQDERLMKVMIDSGHDDTSNKIYIRSKFSEENDIIIQLKESSLVQNPAASNPRPANNLTLHSVYIGPRYLSDNEMLSSTYKVSSIGDSISPLSVSTYWALFAGHGWCVPRGPIGDINITTEDVGSEWKSNVNGNEHYFIIGYVGNYIYFMPKITFDNETGIYSSSWRYTDGFPKNFTHVSGGVNTDSFSCTTSRYDLKIQDVKRKYIVDGFEVGNGTYYCDDFSFTEFVYGRHPGKVEPTDWAVGNIGETVFNGDLIDFSRSFIFKGSSITYNLTISVETPFKVTTFYGIMPQMPVNVGLGSKYSDSYSIFSYLPKVKKGSWDMPFSSNDFVEKTVYKKTSDLYDVHDIPDRCVSYLRNNENGDYLFGMASGFSLVDGITSKNQRNLYLSDGTTGNEPRIIRYGYEDDDSKSNKLYMTIFNGGYSFEESIIPNTFCKNASFFFSWFDPSLNIDGIQVFNYKISEGYVVYIHSQISSSKVAINLPCYMEGMKVYSIIENTVGANLLTEVVSCNKLYASFEPFISDNEENFANYIVLQVK